MLLWRYSWIVSIAFTPPVYVWTLKEIVESLNSEAGFTFHLKVKYWTSESLRTIGNINERDIIGQQLPTLLDVTFCVRLHILLHVVACCWELLLKVWNRSNF